jgi:FkbH-like protein
MPHPLEYPFDCIKILRKKRSFKRELSKKSGLMDISIAILGGSTTSELKDLLEVFLLKEGFRPEFYQSEYNQFFEDLMFENRLLNEFQPELIYLHTSMVNINSFPNIGENKATIEKSIEKEFSKYKELWQQIEKKFNCPVIQNNFELPRDRPLGNLDCSDIHGRTNYILRLNHLFSEYAREHKNFHINDIFYLSSWVGLDKWHDKTLWYSTKYAISLEVLPFFAHNIAKIIKALLGKSQKCLVLDLDNTIWGGIIGEQGQDGLEIGKDTPIGEAFTEFQNYIKELKQRGIILAVCSKNDLAVAKEGFSHPDSILQLEDITVFKANWEPKHENIKSIAREINIDLGSLVFLDDTPAEREIVSAQTPSVKVPNLGNDVTRYIEILDQCGFFEAVSISKEDLKRNRLYGENIKRQELVSRFENYDEFLESLEMKAEIQPFSSLYLDRITQLINKTNQFNLTSKRYTFSQVESISKNPQHITLYGRLADKFGDNGLISVMIGDICSDEITVSLWLMSCRVIKRGMEYAMFDQFIKASLNQGVKNIKGLYLKSPKNNMVKNLYQDLGFKQDNFKDNGDSSWVCEISSSYKQKNKWIKVLK